MSLCSENPYKPLSRNEILSELAQSRECCERGEGEDFDKVVDEIQSKLCKMGSLKDT